MPENDAGLQLEVHLFDMSESVHSAGKASLLAVSLCCLALISSSDVICRSKHLCGASGGTTCFNLSSQCLKLTPFINLLYKARHLDAGKFAKTPTGDKLLMKVVSSNSTKDKSCTVSCSPCCGRCRTKGARNANVKSKKYRLKTSSRASACVEPMDFPGGTSRLSKRPRSGSKAKPVAGDQRDCWPGIPSPLVRCSQQPFLPRRSTSWRGRGAGRAPKLPTLGSLFGWAAPVSKPRWFRTTEMGIFARTRNTTGFVAPRMTGILCGWLP